MGKPIYLDYAATTPVDPRVADAMSACLTSEGVFANPASRSHIYGWQAEEQVERARGQVASLVNCDPREVIWTSGATESNNLALKGVFEAADYKGHLITSRVEHKAVIDPAIWLESRGVDVTWLSPNEDGLITLDQVQQAIKPETKLVSIMHVNNELGSVNPINEIGRLCREKGVLFHVDAAQSAGRLTLDVTDSQIDLISLSAHKFYGPKGIGALYVRRAIHKLLLPMIHGGGQERGLRSGTLPTHQIVGMGEAAQLAKELGENEAIAIASLRDQLWDGIKSLPGVRRNGSSASVACGHLNVCFSGVDGETLLLSLRELAISTGSACTSASLEPSYVLKAIGLSDSDADSSVRISLGRYTTADDVIAAIEHINTVYGQLKSAV